MADHVDGLRPPASYHVSAEGKGNAFVRHPTAKPLADSHVSISDRCETQSDLRTIYITQAAAMRSAPLSDHHVRITAAANDGYDVNWPPSYSTATGQSTLHGHEAAADLTANAPQNWDGEASRIAARSAMARQPDQASVHRTLSRRQKSKRSLIPFGKKLKPSITVDTNVSRHDGELPRQWLPNLLTSDQQNDAHTTRPLNDGRRSNAINSTLKAHCATHSGPHLRATTMRAHAPQSEDRGWIPAAPLDGQPLKQEVPCLARDQGEHRGPGVTTCNAEEKDVLAPPTPTFLVASDKENLMGCLTPQPERELHRPRAASSVYSRATMHLAKPHEGATFPPTSTIPAQVAVSGQRICQVPNRDTQERVIADTVDMLHTGSAHAGFKDSLITRCDEGMELRRKDRVLSNATISEENGSPEAAFQGRTKNVNYLTIETGLPTPRRSRGWWNIINTPFELSRPSTTYMCTPTSDGEMTPSIVPHARGTATMPTEGRDSQGGSLGERSPSSSDCEAASPTPLMGEFSYRHAPIEHPQPEWRSSAHDDGSERRDLGPASERYIAPPAQSEAPRSYRSSQATTLKPEHGCAGSTVREVSVSLSSNSKSGTTHPQDDAGRTVREPHATSDRSTAEDPVPARVVGHSSDESAMARSGVEVPSRGLVMPSQHLRSSSIYKPDAQLEGGPTPPIYTPNRTHAPSTVVTVSKHIRRGTTRPKPSACSSQREKERLNEDHGRGFKCFGRTKSAGGGSLDRRRKKRRWFISCLCLLLLAIVALVVALAVTLTRNHGSMPLQSQLTQSQWLKLTGFPPIPTGILTVARPDVIRAVPGCVQPSTMWSCAVPKEQQLSVAPNDPDQPNLKLEIKFDNGSVPRTSPSPVPPGLEDQTFLGNTTDNNTVPFEGERTPFHISFLSPTPLSSRMIRRDTAPTSTTDPFPDLTTLIPAPDVNSDGTAAAANLLPLPSGQPLRLYNRGLATEHYGFYSYYDRSIFLKSVAPLNDSTVTLGNIPADENGGSTLEGAAVRCTWAQTRFLVQIWTNRAKTAQLVPQSGATTATAASTATASSASSASGSSASVFVRPGTFPYPITVTLDRHGGALDKKLIYCYGVDNRGRIIPSAKKIQLEDRSFGGALANPTDGPFGNVTVSSENGGPGGIDGGNGGCQCQWANWQPKR